MLAGVGVGIELITVDGYNSESVPKRERGRTLRGSAGHLLRSGAGCDTAGLVICSLRASRFVGLALVRSVRLHWRDRGLVGAVQPAGIASLARTAGPHCRGRSGHGRDRSKGHRESGAALPPPGPPVAEVPRNGNLIEAFGPRYRNKPICCR
jgi:putative MFS transporter